MTNIDNGLPGEYQEDFEEARTNIQDYLAKMVIRMQREGKSPIEFAIAVSEKTTAIIKDQLDQNERRES